MQAVKTHFSLWEHVVGTFTSASYYLYIQEFSFWTSLKVFLVGMFLSSVLFSVRILQREAPLWTGIIEEYSQKLSDNYPENLVISWDGRTLSTTPTESVSVDSPTELRSPYFPEKLFYWSPQNVTSAELVNAPYNSHFIVTTPSTFYLQNASNNWSELPLTEVPGFDAPFTITKANQNEVKDKVAKFIETLKPIALMLLVLSSPILMVLNTLAQGLLDVFLFYLLMRLNRYNFGFKKIFQFCLHIWVVAQVINQLTLLLHGQLPISLFSVTFWAVVAYLLFSWNRSIMKMLSS